MAKYTAEQKEVIIPLNTLKGFVFTGTQLAEQANENEYLAKQELCNILQEIGKLLKTRIAELQRQFPDVLLPFEAE